MSSCCYGAAGGGVSRVADGTGACRQAARGGRVLGRTFVTQVQQADQGTGSQRVTQFHQGVNPLSVSLQQQQYQRVCSLTWLAAAAAATGC